MSRRIVNYKVTSSNGSPGGGTDTEKTASFENQRDAAPEFDLAGHVFATPSFLSLLRSGCELAAVARRLKPNYRLLCIASYTQKAST